MKKIKLTNGQEALVDDDDYDMLIEMGNWACTNSPKGGYAYRKPYKSNAIYMHRVIMDAPKGMEVDHINHNKLDNQKSNLRICDHKTNVNSRRVDRCKKTGKFLKIKNEGDGSSKKNS